MDCRNFKKSADIDVIDIAKRLQDYGKRTRPGVKAENDGESESVLKFFNMFKKKLNFACKCIKCSIRFFYFVCWMFSVKLVDGKKRPENILNRLRN